jgi:hypothetical protein
MPNTVNLTPEYWLARADEVLTLARNESDPRSRRTLESIAAHYAELARGCAERSQPDATENHPMPGQSQPTRRRRPSVR